MPVGPKFRPFNASVEELSLVRNSNKKPVFRSRQDSTNLSSIFKKAELTLEDIRPFQVAAAWRIVRSHAMAKGQIGDMEPLSNLGDMQMWTNPMPDSSSPGRSTLSANISDAWAGLPLLPSMLNSRQFAAAVTQTSKILNLRYNPRQPMMGNASLYGLDDHKTVERFFPSYLEIAAHEQSYMALLAEALVYKGHTALITDLQVTDGFSRAEALSLIPLARNYCIQGIEIDLEFDQKMMIARTEGYIKRSQDAADLRGEIQGLKHLATIQGLARIEPADPMKDFAIMVQQLSEEEQEHDRLRLAEATVVDAEYREAGSQNNGAGGVISVDSSVAEDRA